MGSIYIINAQSVEQLIDNVYMGKFNGLQVSADGKCFWKWDCNVVWNAESDKSGWTLIGGGYLKHISYWVWEISERHCTSCGKA